MRGGALMIRDHELSMLYDASICIGCNACTEACKSEYKLNPNIYRTTIVDRQITDPVKEEGTKKTIHYKNACLHCEEASCILACPTGACYRNEDGLVVINSLLCISCNYCAKNCPYNAIIYDKASGNMEKCTLCSDLYKHGIEPVCSQACPVNAISFGPREDILDLGRTKVKGLKKEGYENAYLYGEYEYGGQRVLAVLEENPSLYGLKEDPSLPLMLQNFGAAPIRPISIVTAGLVLGFNFIHSRKYNSKSDEVRDKHHGPPFTYIPPGQDEGDDIKALEERDIKSGKIIDKNQKGRKRR